MARLGDSTSGNITSFSGDYFFLSNFYRRVFLWKDRHWKSAEHALQASKMARPCDYEYVARAETPARAKYLGRTLNRVPEWDDIRLEVMEDLLRVKFADGRIEHTLLQRTGNWDLVEGNTWGDTFWGQCPVGAGENHLGRILMKIRGELNASLG